MLDSDHPPASDALPLPSSDAQLLKRFAATRDGEAFRELVLRHEKLVLGVCRRVLWDEHDAEDAFQATFIVLARRSGELHTGAELSGWLYGVAYRIAVRARARKVRRRFEPLPAGLAIPGDVLSSVARRDELQSFDEELNRLPQKYREPLVLHYLLGRTQNEVAHALGLSVRAVEGRLRRGKAELRYRLARRGVGLAVAAAAARCASLQEAAACPALLAESTVETALDFATGTSAGAASGAAGELARRELSTMGMRLSASGLSAPAAAVALIAVMVTLGGVGRQNPQSSLAEEATRLSLAQSPPDTSASPESAPFAVETIPERVRVYEYGNMEEVMDVQSAEGTSSDDHANANPAASGAIDFKGITDGEVRIRHALQQPSDAKFVGAPLEEVIKALSSNELRIFIDPQGLAQEAVRTDTPINIDFQGISLEAGLELILDPLNLDYIVEEEFLKITSKGRAAEMMETRVYRTRGLSLTSEGLAELVRATIRPQTWGEQSPTAVEPFSNGLVITHSQRAHAEIADLFRQLERHEAAASNLGNKTFLPAAVQRGEKVTLSRDGDLYHLDVGPLGTYEVRELGRDYVVLVEKQTERYIPLSKIMHITRYGESRRMNRVTSQANADGIGDVVHASSDGR